jgi:membrane-bound lytic murein transglycosylase A
MSLGLVFKERLPNPLVHSQASKHLSPSIKFEALSGQKTKVLSRHTLVSSQFDNMSSWDEVDALGSFKAFQQSCLLWSKQNPNHSIGNHKLPMKVKDWLPVCQQALAVPADIDEKQAKQFFSTYFKPFHWKNYHKGKFTGYYAPAVLGSEVKTKEYATPLYDVPHKGRGLHFSRSEIYRGALRGKAKIIAWLKSPVDAMLLEIEGSGVIETSNGKKIFVDYAAENGRRYRSLAQLLIHDRILKPAKASVLGIKAYFAKHPGRLQTYIQRNPSYVFFRRCAEQGFKGAQNVLLTPKYSLAVDRHYIPLGVPLLIKTKYPVNERGDTKAMQRIMIAQDTGGAIKGPIRGDIYWGMGDKAMAIANLMSHEGDYWFLLPKNFSLS